jgi:hypothetical protein
LLSSLFILPSTTAYQIVTLLQASVSMYLAHTYGRYPASAIAVSKVLQDISDEVLPLEGKPLYDYLGHGEPALPALRLLVISTRASVPSLSFYLDNDLDEEEIMFPLFDDVGY